jgi:DNA-binding NarL/FixJ family response regulator
MLELVEAREPQSVSIASDPTKFLTRVNYLDPSDQFDQQLIAYQQNVREGQEPTFVYQNALIEGTKRDSLTSARRLVDCNRGMIAAIAYPFRGQGVEDADLVKNGVRELIRAAKAYDRDEEDNFTDYVALRIHTAFSKILPGIAGDSFVEAHERPMEGVYAFLQTLQVARSPITMRRKLEQDRRDKERILTPRESQVLPLLHLPEADVASTLDLGVERIQDITASLKRKLDSGQRREELALKALERGVKFDVLPIQDVGSFTIEERMVAMRLAKRNIDIADELGISKKRVKNSITSLLRITQARSRAELVLMAHINNLEPTQEEIDIDKATPNLLEQFNDKQKAVLKLAIGFKDKEIASQLGIGARTINNIITRASKKLGVHNRPGLILALHKLGMEFDIEPPEQPISQLLYAHEITIAKNLQLSSYEEIGKIVGLTAEEVGPMVYVAQKKVGARTRQELALMVEMFDDGDEKIELKKDTNRWRLEKSLGVAVLKAHSMDEILSVVTERQAEIVRAYFLANARVTWEQVGEQFGVHPGAVSDVAVKALKKIRQHFNLVS